MTESSTYFVGWDVGGWNCDKNRNSRDSVCVLQCKPELSVVGNVRRGNLRNAIADHAQLSGIVNAFCGTDIAESDMIYLAIDTPLGFSNDFRSLIVNRTITSESTLGSYDENPYLYRRTERWLFENGFPPLSAIKDMIGSQATKGMHLLSKIGATTGQNRVGKWIGQNVTAVEAYPTTCKSSELIADLYAKLQLDELRHDDQFDAVYCALVAYLLANSPDQLIGPLPDVDHEEGWIWVPADSISSSGDN